MGLNNNNDDDDDSVNDYDDNNEDSNSDCKNIDNKQKKKRSTGKRNGFERQIFYADCDLLYVYRHFSAFCLSPKSYIFTKRCFSLFLFPNKSRIHKGAHIQKGTNICIYMFILTYKIRSVCLCVYNSSIIHPIALKVLNVL